MMAKSGRSSSLLLPILLIVLLCYQPNLAASAKGDSFVDAMKHDLFLVTPKSFDTLITSVRNKDGVAMLLHFKSSVAGDKKFIDSVYNEAAKETKGMARFGAIDCDEWKAFCKEHLNPDLASPFMVVYPPNPWLAEPVESRDVKSIVNAALKRVPGKHVQTLNEQNVDTFLGSDLAIPKVLLFSKKDSPPVLFRALSNSFTDRLTFGLVPSSVASVVDRYKVKTFPTIMILKAAVKGTGLGKPLIYTDKAMTFEALHAWVNIHAETFVKGGGFIDEKAAESTPKPWLVQRIPELTGLSNHDVCFKGSKLCVVLLNKGKISDEQMAMLEELDQEYAADRDRGARFKFMWLDVEIESNFREMLKFDLQSAPSVAVINPHKRLRALLLPSDQEANRANIRNLLERIASGDGRFTAIKKLPAFAPRDAEGQPIKKKEEL